MISRRIEYKEGAIGFPYTLFDVFGLLENWFLRNNNNKGSRSNVNKHELVYGESSSNARNARCVFIIVLLFTIFIIVVTQKLVLQQSKKVTAKCTETLSPLLLFNYPLEIGCSFKFVGTIKYV